MARGKRRFSKAETAAVARDARIPPAGPQPGDGLGGTEEKKLENRD